MAVIKAQNLVVGWGNTAVAKLDLLTVATGEIVVVAGPNGAGKSTAVKTIARQIKPLAGSIHIDEDPIAEMDAGVFAKMVAYVPQLISAPQQMTIEEMVSLGRNPHQPWWSWQSTESDTKAIDFALKQTELMHLRKRAVSDLSGGERQRAAIATALAQDTRFMLLDEPTAHLDFKHQLQLLDLLKQLKSIGLGILLVLHDLNLTARLADRVILLTKDTSAAPATPSTIARTGSPSDVFDQETLRRVYQVDVTIIRDDKSGMVGYMPTKPV
jgi:iron complex transport system ATP-binding protein